MVTKPENLDLIIQLANFVCSSVACKGNFLQRVVKYNTDNTFEWMINRINEGRFYFGKFSWSPGSVPTLVNVKYTYTDMITGEQGTFTKNNCVKTLVFGKPLETAIVLGLKYYGLININSIDYYLMNKKNAPGYNITIVPNTGGGTGVTSGTSEPVILPPVINYPSTVPNSPEPVTQTQTKSGETKLSGFDLQGLLIPGVLILAGYFIVKKVL